MRTFNVRGQASRAGHSVLFNTASNWIARLGAAHHTGALEAELKMISRYRLIIIDEVGYTPFDQDAANPIQLFASRYQQGRIMVTSNLPFGRWGETLSDDVAAAAAMIDRLVHHAEVLTLSGDSYAPALPPAAPLRDRWRRRA